MCIRDSLLSVSAHKIHGPKGVGFLYIDEKVKIRPILYGGGQQKEMCIRDRGWVMRELLLSPLGRRKAMGPFLRSGRSTGRD